MQHVNTIYIVYLLGYRKPNPLHFGIVGDRFPIPIPEETFTEKLQNVRE